MKVDARGIILIKSFEGLRLKAYPDPGTGGAPWTIGYGHTGPDVYPGLKITEAQAEELLRKDLARFERGVDRLVAGSFTSQVQFNAMVSLAYNIGLGGFQRSSVLRHHRAGNKLRAAASFLMWAKAAGKTLAGLVRRRNAERQMYLS
jgi:lysozyme